MANHQRLFPLLVLLLAAVTQPAIAQEAVHTSKSLVTADPRGQYLVIKRTFAGMVSNRIIRFGYSSRIFALNDCTSGAQYLGLSDDDPISPLANLAYDIVRLRSGLAATGYPESLWRSPLIQFEDEQLPLRMREMGKPYSDDEFPSARHASAFKERWVREFDNYRHRLAPQLPKVVDGGGCGAGEFGINVRTEPANGRVVFIPVFFYQYCKEQGVDPEDPGSCNRWREATNGVLVEVAGDYFYRALWPDGVLRRGRLRFTNLKMGDTVTIRKQ